MDNNEMMNEKEAAALLGVSLSAVRKWRAEKRGPVVTRVEGAIRYRKSDLEDYLRMKSTPIYSGGKNRLCKTFRHEFWSNQYIERATPHEKLLAVYFATSQLVDKDGLVEVSLHRISFDTGIPVPELKIAIDNMVENLALKRDGSSDLYDVKPIRIIAFGRHE